MSSGPLLSAIIPPREVYLTLIAAMDRVASQRLVNQLIGALTEGYGIVHLLCTSWSAEPSFPEDGYWSHMSSG